MERKPRTLKKSGWYQKIILEESPPCIILQGHKTYEELVTIGKKSFWPEDIERGNFTLCHSDGSRWSKEDFCKEYRTVSDLTHLWKRTLYVRRRELDEPSETAEIVVDDGESGAFDEFPKNHMGQIVVEQNFHSETSSSAEYETGRVRKESLCKMQVDENIGSSAGSGIAVSQGCYHVQL